MTAIASATQQGLRGGAAAFRAASARSEKTEFTQWAPSRLLLSQKLLMTRQRRSRH
tara:strand:+ start:1556 stop:1723 length:168 start_codon:yes stop_codon:yes gene_type:complete